MQVGTRLSMVCAKLQSSNQVQARSWFSSKDAPCNQSGCWSTCELNKNTSNMLVGTYRQGGPFSLCQSRALRSPRIFSSFSQRPPLPVPELQQQLDVLWGHQRRRLLALPGAGVKTLRAHRQHSAGLSAGQHGRQHLRKHVMGMDELCSYQRRQLLTLPSAGLRNPVSAHKKSEAKILNA